MSGTLTKPRAGSTTLLPAGWPKPKGYANGIKARGDLIFIAGQVGWDAQGNFAAGIVAQVRQALENIAAVLAEGGAGPEHLVRLTWYVKDMAAYRGSLVALGAAYREVMGRHYPVMSLVEVNTLVEPEAVVEIEATAVVTE